MVNKILLFILFAFSLSACENNVYQVSELRGATEDLSSGELPPDFKYPKNKLYIDSLKIRIAPCTEHKDERCSAALVSELLMSASTYFDSTLAFTETLFPVKSAGNTRLQSNYMELYDSAKQLAVLNSSQLNLKPEQSAALDKAYAEWKKAQ